MNSIDKKTIGYIIDSIPGLICIDTDGYITFVNKQMEAFRKVPAAGMLGHHITEFFPHTKMLETLNEVKHDRIVYYQGNSATSEDLCESSKHVILRENEIPIGVMSYDPFQRITELEDFLQIYSELDKDIKHSIPGRIYKNTKYSINDIIGESDAIVKMKEDIRRCAASNSTVLITGETGTGKELVAQSIHDLSKRFMETFVELNINSVPETLIESEFFGYEKGAFTGALSEGKIGKFEQANHGTLFIDEIETLAMNVQPKLLRVLQEDELERIGSNKIIPVDVRIICATNVDLEQMVNEKKFRRDLYYRLDVVEIKVPPLRERKSDIPLLSNYFLTKFNFITGDNITGITDAAMKKLISHDWPGNVRELRNVMERATNYTKSNVIEADAIRISDSTIGYEFDFINDKTLNLENPIEYVKKAAEVQIIQDALKKSGGSKTKAAKLLNISRPLLYQKMKRLDIKE